MTCGSVLPDPPDDGKTDTCRNKEQFCSLSWESTNYGKGNIEMKKYEYKYYQAVRPEGGSSLIDTSESMKGIKEIIDRSNTRAAELGYRKESWLIVSVKYSTTIGDDGMFLHREQVESAVQVYPARLD